VFRGYFRLLSKTVKRLLWAYYFADVYDLFYGAMIVGNTNNGVSLIVATLGEHDIRPLLNSLEAQSVTNTNVLWLIRARNESSSV
jgi:hypothetical protein